MCHHATNWGGAVRVGNSTAKHLLRVLCDRADAEGACFGKRAKLADALEVSERAVREAEEWLRALGLLAVELRDPTNRDRATFIYRLAVGAAQPTAAQIAAAKATKDRRRNGAAEGGTVGGDTRNHVPDKAARGGTTFPLTRNHVPPDLEPRSTPSIDEPPINHPRTLTPQPPASGGPGAADHFDRFKRAYPKPDGMAAAERAFARQVRKGHDPETILAGLDACIALGALNPAEGGRYCPEPAKWLRQGRWRDWRERARRIHEHSDTRH